MYLFILAHVPISQTVLSSLTSLTTSSLTKYPGLYYRCIFLVVPARVALLQSINIWVGDSGVSIYCMNNRCRGSNISKGSGTGTVGVHREAMTASIIMDIAGT